MQEDCGVLNSFNFNFPLVLSLKEWKGEGERKGKRGKECWVIGRRGWHKYIVLRESRVKGGGLVRKLRNGVKNLKEIENKKF